MATEKIKAPEKLILETEEGGSITVGIEELYSNEVFDPNEEVLIPVSPGQLYHGNGIFSTFLKYAQQNKLDVHVVNSGFLQRFTVQLISGRMELDERVKNKTNIDVTDNWDKRNLGGKNEQTVALMENDKQLKVSYWENWIGVHREPGKYKIEFNRETFVSLTEAIHKSYSDKDQTFKKAIDSAINAFYVGFHKTHARNADYIDLFETIKEEGVKKIIQQYLLEEVTVIFYWQCIGKTQMAYPFLQNATGKKTIDAVRALSSKWLKDDELKRFLPHGQMRFLNLEAKKEEPKQQKTAGRHRSKEESIATTSSPREEAVSALVHTERKNSSDTMSGSPPKHSGDYLEQKLKEAEEKIRKAEEEKLQLAQRAESERRQAEEERRRLAAEKEEIDFRMHMASSVLKFKFSDRQRSEAKEAAAIKFLDPNMSAAQLLGNGLSLFSPAQQTQALPLLPLSAGSSAGNSKEPSPEGTPPGIESPLHTAVTAAEEKSMVVSHNGGLGGRPK